MLSHRGPDGTRSMEFHAQHSVNLNMIGSLLGLRGEPTYQPVTDSDDNVLLFNGQVYSYYGIIYVYKVQIFGGGVGVGRDENDTMKLLKALQAADDVQSVLANVHGPWALIYWQARTQTLWFGRDANGRRSLLFRLSDEQFVISSVGANVHADTDDASVIEVSAPSTAVDEDPEDGEAAVTYGWKEVPACGLFALKFDVCHEVMCINAQ